MATTECGGSHSAVEARPMRTVTVTLLDIARRRPVWWYAGVLTLAGLARLLVLGVQSFDFRHFVTYWWAAAGSDPVHALTGNVHNYDYTPAYIGILVVAHPVLGWLTPVVAIKLISVVGDIACAMLVGRIVRRFRPDPAYGRLAFAVVVLLPTVITDSSVFGQVDSLYAALLLAGVLGMLRGHQRWALVALGLALAFKFQAIFLAPAVAGLLVIGVIKWRHVWWAPAATLAAFVPAVLAGRSVLGVLGTYSSQAGKYPFLTLDAPNAYAWWQNPPPGTYPPQGSVTGGQGDIDVLTAAYPRVGHETITILTAVAIVLCALLVFFVWHHRQTLLARTDQKWIVLLCAVSAMLVPYALPSMHERYFYPADLLALTVAFVMPTRAPRIAAVLALAASTVAYLRAWFVYDGHVLPLGVPGLAMTGALILLLRELWRVAQDRSYACD